MFKKETILSHNRSRCIDVARHLAIQVKPMKPEDFTKIEFIRELKRRSNESLTDCIFVVEFLQELLKK